MSLLDYVEYGGVQGWRVGRFRGWINTNCYLYRFDDVLIDTGPPNQWAIVHSILISHPVQAVYVTHHHEDHGGNCAAIHAAFSIPIYVHPRGMRYFEQGLRLPYYRRIIWGVPATVKVHAFPETIQTNKGRQIVPLHTPGHTADMACFYIPQEGWLFTGDLFITTRPRIIRKVEDPLEEMNSLRRVLKYEFQVIFCSHRGVQKRGRQLLQEKLQFLEEIYHQTAHLLKKGKSTAEISRQLLGTEGLLTWITGFHFAKKNLIEAFAREILNSHSNGRNSQ